MHILVTGATGRVGSRLVPRLLRHHQVRILARDAQRAEPLGRAGAEVQLGDLRDEQALATALAGIDTVVHVAAAFRGVPEAEAVAVNHTATVALGRAALVAGVGDFIDISTTLVYGPGRGRPAVDTDRPQPVGAYPVSKYAAEQDLLHLHRTEGLPLRILRLAFVYGDGDPHLAESLRWARQWPRHKRLQLVHHADVSQALLRLLRTPGSTGRIFDVADDAPVTAWELAQLNGQEPDPDAPPFTGQDDPWEGIVDTGRIRDELGFSPIHPTVYAARYAGAL